MLASLHMWRVPHGRYCRGVYILSSSWTGACERRFGRV